MLHNDATELVTLLCVSSIPRFRGRYYLEIELKHAKCISSIWVFLQRNEREHYWSDISPYRSESLVKRKLKCRALLGFHFCAREWKWRDLPPFLGCTSAGSVLCWQCYHTCVTHPLFSVTWTLNHQTLQPEMEVSSTQETLTDTDSLTPHITFLGIHCWGYSVFLPCPVANILLCPLITFIFSQAWVNRNGKVHVTFESSYGFK